MIGSQPRDKNDSLTGQIRDDNKKWTETHSY